MKQLLGGVIAVAALALAAGHSGEAPATQTSPPLETGRGYGELHLADHRGSCRTLSLGETAVAMLSNEPIVKVLANGVTLILLLDTGAEATVLTPAAAQRVGAPYAHVEFGRQVHAITGDMPAAELELHSFTIGGVDVPRRRVRVAPIEIVNVLSGPLDGVLGADTLSSFDIDLDLPSRRMTLYQEQSCGAASPAWTQPYARIAAGRSANNRLYFPVQLDGRRITALFDTGAQFSVLPTRTAATLGVSEAALARDPPVAVLGALGDELTAHAHRFFRLEVGGEVIRNAQIDVTEMRLNEADLVLGIDFLGSRRVWLSYGSQQLFLMRRI